VSQEVPNISQGSVEIYCIVSHGYGHDNSMTDWLWFYVPLKTK